MKQLMKRGQAWRRKGFPRNVAPTQRHRVREVEAIEIFHNVKRKHIEGYLQRNSRNKG